jgi:predicted amidohydrolase
MTQDLTVTLIQSDLVWHDIDKNLSAFDQKLKSIEEDTDLIILPEMFTTGYSMNAAELSEDMDGSGVAWLREKAHQKQAAIVGSLIIREEGQYYNRLIWMNPDGSHHHYEKRHLFSMAGEDRYYSPGSKKLIIPYMGWNICPLVCYDLRFPVWSRNTNLQYDLLIYIASWPNKRAYDWNTLLRARAIENQSYVIGVNRVGTDGNGMQYNGDSCIIDPGWNKTLYHEQSESIHTMTLSKSHLLKVREKLPFSQDADRFTIEG